MILREPKSDELAALSGLCLRSKAHWGYSGDMLKAFEGELTVTPQDLADDAIMLAEDKRGVAGVVQLSKQGEDAVLEKLFVEPARLGEGTGKLLYVWACRVARENGARNLLIDSDPDAAGFYEGLGAVRSGTAKSGSIPGRTLPHLVHPLG
ncbi:MULTISPECIES: GNAT family N-acetyltransferase [Hyphomonas]|uniref:GNAT family N-acetyltransferase n=1 Tax=Hyphomonas adhaerens TaxID=81029 RepID=A0A3B9H0Q1_9PROT|nr:MULTISPECIES: GNAT family N-acetyltransferase [Hyphomonas]MBB39758.1 GNAT family N-acetyltransferase [Hyphomonas sp.]HAE28282.1 GNAT family N-acetyltransferase [Hyphomonas adhaerens]|tara:strand:+ start:6719 stop:7171 length:453 start_codon:yes stop_codon:yes gene_type:complete